MREHHRIRVTAHSLWGKHPIAALQARVRLKNRTTLKGRWGWYSTRQTTGCSPDKMLVKQQYMLLQRNLVYTGMTRGKKLVVLISQRKALRMTVRNSRTENGISGLPGQAKGHCLTGVTRAGRLSGIVGIPHYPDIAAIPVHFEEPRGVHIARQSPHVGPCGVLGKRAANSGWLGGGEIACVSEKPPASARMGQKRPIRAVRRKVGEPERRWWVNLRDAASDFQSKADRCCHVCREAGGRCPWRAPPCVSAASGVVADVTVGANRPHETDCMSDV
jgi:hypothetical protein